MKNRITICSNTNLFTYPLVRDPTICASGDSGQHVCLHCQLHANVVTEYKTLTASAAIFTNWYAANEHIIDDERAAHDTSQPDQLVSRLIVECWPMALHLALLSFQVQCDSHLCRFSTSHPSDQCGPNCLNTCWQ